MRCLPCLLLVLAACDLGEVPPAGGTGIDGGGDAGGSDAAALACADRGTPGTPHDHGGGDTKAGQACMVVGCHVAGGGGPLFAAMGTVFKADNTTPNAGAVVRLTYGGMTKSAVTDTAGNFTFSSTITPTFPADTDASACPDTVKMGTKISSAADLNCNRAGCHDNAANRINFQ